jgi:hypothetical protein
MPTLWRPFVASWVLSRDQPVEVAMHSKLKGYHVLRPT